MRKGFTIIEVIVTFVILSILIFFAIYSFRYSVANVKKASYFIPKTSIVFSSLDRILSGMYYYVIEKENRVFVNYFQADETQIKFITTSPLYSDRLTIAQLSYKDNKLIFMYEPFYNKKTDIEKPKLTKSPKKVILMENISTLKITYVTHKGDTLEKISDEIPKGIIFKFSSKGEKYTFIFSSLTDFLDNKASIYHAKYPI